MRQSNDDAAFASPEREIFKLELCLFSLFCYMRIVQCPPPSRAADLCDERVAGACQDSPGQDYLRRE